ncbi:hypothetical protein POTOM_032081 [Populus tomentosa]|uniref:Uncharacterized protein n=1 Tax=Populus tomentosa TaxID=118781 RepID=A0A8X8CS68_POPTO|nr:hypothetical protein POTOM_032081 [Populus tomentosa]
MAKLVAHQCFLIYVITDEVMLWKVILDAKKFQQTFQLTARLYLFLGSFLPPCNMYWFTFNTTLAQET